VVCVWCCGSSCKEGARKAINIVAFLKHNFYHEKQLTLEVKTLMFLTYEASQWPPFLPVPTNRAMESQPVNIISCCKSFRLFNITNYYQIKKVSQPHLVFRNQRIYRRYAQNTVVSDVTWLCPYHPIFIGFFMDYVLD